MTGFIEKSANKERAIPWPAGHSGITLLTEERDQNFRETPSFNQEIP